MFTWLEPSAPATPTSASRLGLLGAPGAGRDGLHSGLGEGARGVPCPSATQDRSNYVRWISGEIHARRAPGDLLDEFLLIETDFGIAVEAALEIASLDRNAPRRLTEIDGWDDIQCPGAPMGGLLFCGDADVTREAVEGLIGLSTIGLRALSQLRASRLLTAEVEIWLTLAELFADADDPRLEIAAAALVRIAEKRRGEDAVRYRTIGLGRSGPRIVAECPFEVLATRVCTRVRSLPDFGALDRAASAWGA